MPRLAALASAAAAARAGSEEGIHQARVASRRLREVVPVVGGDAGAVRAARRGVRRVTRALGPVRELDVSLRLYGTIVLTPAVGTVADTAVRRALSTRRLRALGAARASLTPGRLARLEHDVAALAASASRTPRTQVIGDVDVRIARRAGALARAIDRAGLLYVPERLHAVRIAAKQLRYALEVAGDIRWGATASARRLLKAVQDQLGDAHDLHVLALLAGAVEVRMVTRSRTAARDLQRLERDLDRRCRLLHAGYLARRQALQALAATLGAADRRRVA